MARDEVAAVEANEESTWQSAVVAHGIEQTGCTEVRCHARANTGVLEIPEQDGNNRALYNSYNGIGIKNDFSRSLLTPR